MESAGIDEALGALARTGKPLRDRNRIVLDLVRDLKSFSHRGIPSIPYDFKSKLPDIEAVYILYADAQVFYVGQSRDIRKRWASHGVESQFSGLDIAGELRIGWMEVPQDLLMLVESFLIGSLSPLFNKQ